MKNYKLILFTLFFGSGAFADPLTIDISGADGSGTVDGVCCEYMDRTTSLNETPRRGDDAVAGTPGEHSNNLDLQLSETGGVNAEVVVYGLVYGGENGNQPIAEINENVSLTSSIFVNASGGEGARAGQGGQGQDSCHGIDGADATESNNGTNGTDSCDSGSGGDASPAQPGGDGGYVRVQIPANQTHLALLVSADTSAGDGGDPNNGGQGGDVGTPGKGGDSLTYISDYVDQPACPEIDTGTGFDYDSGGGFDGGGVNDLGNGYDSFESNLDPNILDRLKDAGEITAEVLAALVGISPAYACGGRDAIYDTNSGGNNGDYGTRGGSGDDEPRGRRGNEGQVEFVVVDERGRATSYQRPFNLELLSYRVSDSAPGGNEDGIFEPNEILTISNLRIKNTALMPSPAMADVVLSLQTANWIITNPVDQVMVPTLSGGQEITLSDVFTVRVRNAFTAGNNQSWSLSDTIIPRGSIPRIQRNQNGLSLPQTVHMSFPVSITPIQSISVIGPGETAEIQWRVQNLSNSDFRGLNNETRKIEVSISRSGGDARLGTIESVEFEYDEISDETSFLRTITDLRARESIVISGSINFSQRAQPYTYIDMRSSLGLEILGTSNMMNIMGQSHRIKISQTYRYNEDSSVLLLTSSQTTRTEFDAWMALFERLNIKADVWDVSYNRELNLVKDLTLANSGESLVKNYSGKTIILLNNEEGRGGEFDTLRMLNRTQFFQAASEEDINFYVVGGSSQALQAEVIGMHFMPNALSANTLNIENFVSAIQSQDLNSRQTYVLSSDDSESYQKAYEALRESPNSQQSLFYSRSGSEVRLALIPSLSMLDGQMVAYPATSNKMNNPSFIQSLENIRPLMLSLSLDEKINIFKYVGAKSSSDDQILNTVSSHLIHDLVEALYGWKFSVDESNKTVLLEKVKNFISMLTNGDLDPSDGFEIQLGRVLAALDFFSLKVGNNEMQTLVSTFMNTHSEKSKASYQEYKTAYGNFAEKRKELLVGDYNEIYDAYKMFTLPVIGRALTSENILLVKPTMIQGGL